MWWDAEIHLNLYSQPNLKVYYKKVMLKKRMNREILDLRITYRKKVTITFGRDCSATTWCVIRVDYNLKSLRRKFSDGWSVTIWKSIQKEKDKKSLKILGSLLFFILCFLSLFSLIIFFLFFIFFSRLRRLSRHSLLSTITISQ